MGIIPLSFIVLGHFLLPGVRTDVRDVGEVWNLVDFCSREGGGDGTVCGLSGPEVWCGVDGRFFDVVGSGRVAFGCSVCNPDDFDVFADGVFRQVVHRSFGIGGSGDAECCCMGDLFLVEGDVIIADDGGRVSEAVEDCGG